LPWEAQLSFMQLFGPVVDEVRCNTHIGHNIQPTYLPQSPHPPVLPRESSEISWRERPPRRCLLQQPTIWASKCRSGGFPLRWQRDGNPPCSHPPLLRTHHS
jgi:hypothetical protein